MPQYAESKRGSMGLKTELKALVDELDRVHKGAAPWTEEVGIPEFVTAENGLQRFFTQNARKMLGQFSNTLYQNRAESSAKVEIEVYESYVRQAVADMHAADEFLGLERDGPGNLRSRLKGLVEERLEKLANAYTHYFPAWTLGMEKNSPFSLGPVTIMNRTDWIDTVDFPQQGKDQYLNQPDANHRWREILKDALQRPRDDSPIEGLAHAVYGAVAKCPALVKVTICGYERQFSRKLARLVSKTALDSISLGLGAPECFLQQALQDERLPPVGSKSLVETNGFLWLPGSTLGGRVPSLSPARVEQALTDMDEILPAFEAILEGLVDPRNHRHPKLVNRWATALDWFGEGNREASDAIALAKLGTCLDVLCCGGKNTGIRDMVVHLTGTDGETQVISGRRPRTLKQLVKDIYDHGRSQILHGTHYDRLESFSVERTQAAYLARIVLIESALRLQSYAGPDDEKAFRAI